MQHSIGILQNQLRLTTLEDSISQDNPVLFLDAFVEHIALESDGFKVQTIKEKVRTNFYSKVFFEYFL